MSNKGQLLQDPFLNTLRKEHIPVIMGLYTLSDFLSLRHGVSCVSRVAPGVYA